MMMVHELVWRRHEGTGRVDLLKSSDDDDDDDDDDADPQWERDARRPQGDNHDQDDNDGNDMDDDDDNDNEDDERTVDSNGYEIVQGENWLRLVQKDTSSVLDYSQSQTQSQILTQTQSSQQQQQQQQQQPHHHRKIAIYPSIVSVSSYGGVDWPTNDCYICIDVDHSLLAIKDMRLPLRLNHGNTSTRSAQSTSQPQQSQPQQSQSNMVTTDPTEHAQQEQEHHDGPLGVLEKGTAEWKVLPRRQIKLLHPGDKICTSLDLDDPSAGLVFEYKYRQTGRRRKRPRPRPRRRQNPSAAHSSVASNTIANEKKPMDEVMNPFTQDVEGEGVSFDLTQSQQQHQNNDSQYGSNDIATVGAAGGGGQSAPFLPSQLLATQEEEVDEKLEESSIPLSQASNVGGGFLGWRHQQVDHGRSDKHPEEENDVMDVEDHNDDPMDVDDNKSRDEIVGGNGVDVDDNDDGKYDNEDDDDDDDKDSAKSPNMLDRASQPLLSQPLLGSTQDRLSQQNVTVHAAGIDENADETELSQAEKTSAEASGTVGVGESDKDGDIHILKEAPSKNVVLKEPSKTPDRPPVAQRVADPDFDSDDETVVDEVDTIVPTTTNNYKELGEEINANITGMSEMADYTLTQPSSNPMDDNSGDHGTVEAASELDCNTQDRTQPFSADPEIAIGPTQSSTCAVGERTQEPDGASPESTDDREVDQKNVDETMSLSPTLRRQTGDEIHLAEHNCQSTDHTSKKTPESPIGPEDTNAGGKEAKNDEYSNDGDAAKQTIPAEPLLVNAIDSRIQLEPPCNVDADKKGPSSGDSHSLDTPKQQRSNMSKIRLLEQQQEQYRVESPSFLQETCSHHSSTEKMELTEDVSSPMQKGGSGPDEAEANGSEMMTDDGNIGHKNEDNGENQAEDNSREDRESKSLDSIFQQAVVKAPLNRKRKVDNFEEENMNAADPTQEAVVQKTSPSNKGEDRKVDTCENQTPDDEQLTDPEEMDDNENGQKSEQQTGSPAHSIEETLTTTPPTGRPRKKQKNGQTVEFMLETPPTVTRSTRRAAHSSKQDNTLSVGLKKGPTPTSVIRVMTSGVDVGSVQKKWIRDIGGILIEKLEDASTATHLIISKEVKRTPKLMIALCTTGNIVSMDWLQQSAKEKKALPTDKFLLVSGLAVEKLYSFKMRETLSKAGTMRSRGESLLGGYIVFLPRGVAGNTAKDNRTPPTKEFKLILQAAGAIVVAALPRQQDDYSDTVIVTSKLPKEAKKQLAVREVANAVERGALAINTDDLFQAFMTQNFVVQGT